MLVPSVDWEKDSQDKQSTMAIKRVRRLMVAAIMRQQTPRGALIIVET
jgi:hypothetical protein